MTSVTITNNRGGAGEIETFAMANCLMLLSSQGSSYDPKATSDPTRTFSCKTCGRKFPSFQALGGHRASHNKNKLAVAGDFSDVGKSPAPAKPKTHACSICGLEFPIGQALGGHMRRHRPVLLSSGGAAVSTVTSEGSVEKSDGGINVIDMKKRKNDDVSMPVLKKSGNSGKRICLDLNLNFAPWKDEQEVVNDKGEIGGGEIVEQEEREKQQQEEEEQSDFLKLELRQPINCSLSI